MKAYNQLKHYYFKNHQIRNYKIILTLNEPFESEIARSNFSL